MGVAAIGHVTQMPRINFRSPYPWSIHTKFGFDQPSGLGEDVEIVDGRTDGLRRF